ncbi:tripartite tricarboxylate transporter substrate binding protein [Microbacterium karelineae]|uniref:tripartite tricarboxylate transporter substrate binding protein n=1 Tax=Microbacterium karelineae TaxID=2654283 RepID=UPI0012E9A879|nr:tripartite tricarboxylate transporter substrate binding protein [Microbacterium karelineae]
MPRTRITRLTVAVSAAAIAVGGLAACTPVDSEEGGDAAFPQDDIRLIIQADAGGGSDLSSRALATELENTLGVSVIAENMPGAAGALAMEYVADQPADGYTIGFGPVEIAMLNTTQGADVLPENYDMLGQIMLAPGVIAVSASSDIETLEDLVEQSKSGEVTVATAGAGSIWEAAALGFAEQSGAALTPVAYDGGAPAVSAAASGETVASVSGLGEALAQSDAVRILGIMHDERHPDAADVPTVSEALGVDVEFGGWGGIYAPAGLPDDVHATLEDAIAQAVASDSYQQFQDDAGNLVVYRDAEEHTAFVDEQFALFEELLG